jgi:hypothetical protein
MTDYTITDHGIVHRSCFMLYHAAPGFPKAGHHNKETMQHHDSHWIVPTTTLIHSTRAAYSATGDHK